MDFVLHSWVAIEILNISEKKPPKKHLIEILSDRICLFKKCLTHYINANFMKKEKRKNVWVADE